MAKQKVGRPKDRPTKKVQINVPEMYYEHIKDLVREFAFSQVLELDKINGLDTERKFLMLETK